MAEFFSPRNKWSYFTRLKTGTGVHFEGKSSRGQTNETETLSFSKKMAGCSEMDVSFFKWDATELDQSKRSGRKSGFIFSSLVFLSPHS